MSELDVIDISATAEEKQLLKELAENPWTRCYGYLPRAFPKDDRLTLTMGEFYVELDGTGTYFRHLADDEPDIEYERFTIYKSDEGPIEKTLEEIEPYILNNSERLEKFYKARKTVYLGATWDGFFQRSTFDTIKHTMSDGALFVNEFGFCFICLCARTWLNVSISFSDTTNIEIEKFYSKDKDFNSFEKI